jgi:ABC-type protease/lipase transport system fused ATPase/permease subunit
MNIALLVMLVIIVILLFCVLGALEGIRSDLQYGPRMPWEGDRSTFNVIRTPGEGGD